MKPPKFKYRGFGLNIGSDIEFPELFSHDFEQEDVRVEAGPIEDPWFDANDFQRITQKISPGIYRCLVPYVGRYVVTDGVRLQIEPWGNADQTAFRMYALTAAFSACLVQRNHMLLHASGVILNGAAFLFAGASGVGKSTLISHLMRRGYRIFSDDVCVFNGRKDIMGRWLTSSSYPVMKLEEQGLTRFFPDVDKQKIWPDAEKFAVSFHGQYEPTPLPANGIVIISKDHRVREILVEKVSGIMGFEKLSACTYRPGLIQTIAAQRMHAHIVSGLAHEIPVYAVRRPEEQDDGSDLVNELELLMNNRQINN
jgi:hypothetical protein